jgi:hypothetical protein
MCHMRTVQCNGRHIGYTHLLATICTTVLVAVILHYVWPRFAFKVRYNLVFTIKREI